MNLEEYAVKLREAFETFETETQRRRDNMFLGPPGLEETVRVLQVETNQLRWAVFQLTQALIEEKRGAQSEVAE